MNLRNLLGTSREPSGNLPGTFREPSGNLPGTSENLWFPEGSQRIPEGSRFPEGSQRVPEGSQRLVRTDMVRVGPSNLLCGESGLFARETIIEGTVVACFGP
jgi:hypothetical protein